MVSVRPSFGVQCFGVDPEGLPDQRVALGYLVLAVDLADADPAYSSPSSVSNDWKSSPILLVTESFSSSLASITGST